MRHRRCGLTLIELVVASGIVAILLGVLVPAVRNVREAANRARCDVKVGKTCHETVSPGVKEASQATLRSALEAWRAGQTQQSLIRGSPSIVIQDHDWMNGYKLIEYHILDQFSVEDSDFRFSVELTLMDESGRESSRKIAYIVGSRPNLTVFRAKE